MLTVASLGTLAGLVFLFLLALGLIVLYRRAKANAAEQKRAELLRKAAYGALAAVAAIATAAGVRYAWLASAATAVEAEIPPPDGTTPLPATPTATTTPPSPPAPPAPTA